MRLRVLAILYMISVSLSIFGLWAMLYVTDSIPEMETQPAFITMHIVAEYASATMLMVAAYGMLREREDQMTLFSLAMGMLVYTLVVSPGYYMDSAGWGFVAMFSILLAIAVSLLVLAIRYPDAIAPERDDAHGS